MRLPKTLRVHVANVGIPKDEAQCGIARAIRDQYPDFTHIKVGKTTLGFRVPADDCRYVWATPRTARRFIVDHDRGFVPEELVFELRRDEAEVKLPPVRRSRVVGETEVKSGLRIYKKRRREL